jgi:hypothetical protein
VEFAVRATSSAVEDFFAFVAIEVFDGVENAERDK